MLSAVIAFVLGVTHIRAYTPAVPTNDTNAVNQSDISMLTMKWAPAGMYSNSVSFQLASSSSQGFDQGAFVHFTEQGLSNASTTTPWIAFVNCDANTTNASQVDDIFTLAHERGAMAALLYSLTSEVCLIEAEYTSPRFVKVLDIFATRSKASAQLINSQFMNLHNASFSNYDAVQLNNSASAVAASLKLEGGDVTSPFIVGTLRATNSTTSSNGTSTTQSTPNTASALRGKLRRGSPMISLYAIIGCVSSLVYA